MLLTGNPITAEEAFVHGLVSKLANDQNDLEEQVNSICQAIKVKPKAVVQLGKRFYQQQLEMGISVAMNE